MIHPDANNYIEKLELNPHPEGGYYKSTFQSTESISNSEITSTMNGKRNLYTSIYFLLTSKNVSHFHRLKSDELWYYHAGSSLTIHMIKENGDYEEIKLGLNVNEGEIPQALVPKNVIFGSSVMEEDTFSLVGCMVAPGFDFEDFELFTQKELLADYPDHAKVIRRLAYETLPE